MSKKTLLIAATALVACTGFVLPAAAKPDTQVRGTVMFWLLDRNNDGAIDKVEVEELRATIFDAVDANNDGRVTKEEFVAVIENFQVGRGKHGDAQGRQGARDDRGGDERRHGNWDKRGPGPRDGQSEERGDRHDGKRKGEYAEKRGGHGPRHGQMEGRDGPRDGSAGPRGEHMLKQLGIDTPEGLSKSDFVSATPKLFDRADKDGNGTVSESEFEQSAANIGRLIIME